MNGDLSPNAENFEYQAGFVTIENRAIPRQPQMATVRWLTWKGVDEVQVNDLRPIISSTPNNYFVLFAKFKNFPNYPLPYD
jgi:hypothetical protein